MKKILLSLIFFALVSAMFIFRHYLSIFYFQNDVNKIVFNMETSVRDDFYICFNSNCDKLKPKNRGYFYKLNQENPMFYNGEINNIEVISSNKNLSDNIKSISIFQGKDLIYYSKDEIKNFHSNQTTFQDKSSFSYKIPFETNQKTFLQKASVYFESIFYNWYFYIIFWVGLIYYLAKYKANPKINILAILILGLILRLSHIDFVPLWNDELYTIYYIFHGGIKNIAADPGNPPLFFIISDIWLCFFHKTTFLIRLLPVLIGLLQIYTIYFVTDKLFNKKIAYMSAFLSAINIFIITESNEIRSYILSMAVIPIFCYLFYRLKENFNTKNIIVYTIFGILLFNLHYYTILTVGFNFLLGMIIFKNNKIKFLLSNFVAFLSFLPYFLHIKSLSLSNNFNAWLEKPTLEVIHNHIIFYFGKTIFFIVAVIFCIYVYKKYLKKSLEGKIFMYNTILISIVFISAYFISVFIKPILFERYFCIFLPLFIINTSILLNVEYKFKNIMFVVILLFSINCPRYENFNIFSNINQFISFSQNDYLQNKEYTSYFIIPDKFQYIKHFPLIPKERVIVSNYGVREDVDLIKEYKKHTTEEKILLYIPEICTNSEIKYSDDKNIEIVETTMVPLYKVFLN